MSTKYSTKKKWVAFLLCLFLFPIGAHAFYAQRYARGFFFVGSFIGVTTYYTYTVYKIKALLSHIPFLKSMGSWTIFSAIVVGGSILQYIPFLGFVKYLTTYLVYIFLLGILLWIYDLFVILCGRFHDGDYNRIVSKKRKNK